MAGFVVIFLGLCAIALILTPLVWRLLRENGELQHCVQSARLDVIKTLQKSEFYQMACETASDGLVIQDMSGRIIWANPAYGRIHGHPTEDLIGRNPLEFVFPDGVGPTAEEITAFRYDSNDPANTRLQLFENQHADGHMFWNQINVAFKRFADGRENAILVCRDVTEQVAQEKHLLDIRERLEHEATHDALTGVQNRAAFLSFVNDALNDPNHAPVGLLHIDLDNFKAVNDTHGHSAGDAVLVHTARALKSNIRSSDIVARVGGDEFVVVCRDMTTLLNLEILAKDLSVAIAAPFDWTGRSLHCAASIGAALSSDLTTTPESLLVQADFALYEAKRGGRNQVALYDEDLHDRHACQIQRAGDLTDAIDTGAIDYHFQPTLCLTTGRIMSMETLVRWDHPVDGIIPPDDFLPMVKDLGLMGPLDLLSMTAALQEKHALNQAGFSNIGIAFNASPELLSHPDFVSRLVWGVEAGGLRRDQITIEVLETTDFGEATETSSHAAAIRDLRHAGFQVHLDDFGAGFAGLAHLAELDVTGVKIDRGLITNLLVDETSRKIVRKIVELANDLGLTVIAEGVEDLKTANNLRAMGCNLIQGYWLSRPKPSGEIHRWLADRQRRVDPRSA